MEIQAECDCGTELKITGVTTSSVAIWITVEKCGSCAEDNYKEGEADAEQYG